MGKIKEERPQPGNKERGTMELERRGHLAASRVLSNGPDIRPDVNVSPNEYVKVEDFHKWMKANDAVLRARTRQSFVAGAICGVFVLVAIIMAGVSLGKLDVHDQGLKAQVSKVVTLEETKLDSSVLTTKLNDLKTDLKTDYESYAKSCIKGEIQGCRGIAPCSCTTD